jgi:hypothetical protein
MSAMVHANGPVGTILQYVPEVEDRDTSIYVDGFDKRILRGHRLAPDFQSRKRTPKLFRDQRADELRLL